MKKWLSRLTVALCLILCCTVLATGCAERPTDDDKDPPEVGIPVEPNFDFSAISDSESWKGGESRNPVFDTANGFLTFREKSNASLAYGKKGMNTGSIELLLKVTISSDTNATVTFSNQAADLSAFSYQKGSKAYSLEFASNSKMLVKKWVDGADVKLTGSKDTISVPLAFSLNFTPLKIDVTEEGSTVGIKVYTGQTLLLDVSDSDNAILGGGAVGLSYTGKGGMAAAKKGADLSKYTPPESLGLNIYDQPDKPVAEGPLNLLSEFSTNWTGRNRIFDAQSANGGIEFTSHENVEEPQPGVTEYQGIYTPKIFKDAQFDYTFNVLAQGDWQMFWLRCVPERSTNVSIWGNKQTKEYTNGYSALITSNGYVQIHKWADGAQIWLNGQGTLLPGAVRALFSDPKATISLKMSIEEIEIAGKPAVEFRVKINEANTIVVQDTDTPFVNAGYTGVQGYAIANGISSIRLLTASANSTITL